MADSPTPKNGKLLPFVSSAPSQTPRSRDVLALVYAFNDFQAARLARIAATPPHLKIKDDRRQKR